MSLSHRLMLAGVVVGAVGCGGARQPEYASLGLVEVSGTVKLDGEPLADAMVAFENPADKTFSFAKTNAAGGYKLMFNSERFGCTPGKKIVRISSYREPDADPVEATSDSKIPASYGRQSELTAEVDSSHRSFDFDLKSK